MGHPGTVANPARGQLTRKNKISLSAFAPENLVSRDGFGSPVPRQPAHLHTSFLKKNFVLYLTIILLYIYSGAYLLRDSSRVPRLGPFIYL